MSNYEKSLKYLIDILCEAKYKNKVNYSIFVDFYNGCIYEVANAGENTKSKVIEEYLDCVDLRYGYKYVIEEVIYTLYDVFEEVDEETWITFLSKIDEAIEEISLLWFCSHCDEMQDYRETDNGLCNDCNEHLVDVGYGLYEVVK